MTLRKIAIFPNPEYDREYQYTAQAVRVLSENGILSVLSSSAQPFFTDPSLSVQFFDEADDMMETADAILVLGGDGTMIDMGAVLGGALFAIRWPVINLMGVESQYTASLTAAILAFYCCWCPLRQLNYVLVVGILRAGGDTKFLILSFMNFNDIEIAVLLGLTYSASNKRSKKISQGRKIIETLPETEGYN